MSLDAASIHQFKQIFFATYGEMIDDDRAYELANNLLNLYRVVYLVDGKKTGQEHETKLQHTHHQG